MATSSKPLLNTRELDERRLHAEVAEEQASWQLASRSSTIIFDTAPLPAEQPAQPEYAPPRTLGEPPNGARFVVDRRPTQAGDGSWIVVRSDTSHEDAIFADVCGAGVALTFETTSERELLSHDEPRDEDAEWPSLACATGGGGSGRASERSSSTSELTDEDDSCDDGFILVVDEPTDSKPNATADEGAPAKGAWADGAATLSAIRAAAVLTTPRSRKPALLPGGGVGWLTLAQTRTKAPSKDEAEDGWERILDWNYPKDASHRLHGSKSKSVKLVQRRQAQTLARMGDCGSED